MAASGGKRWPPMGRNRWPLTLPDRVRALTLDGVIDPVEWTTGRTPAEAQFPVEYRRQLDANGTLPPDVSVEAIESQRKERSRLAAEIAAVERELDEALRSLGGDGAGQ